jgi:transposase
MAGNDRYMTPHERAEHCTFAVQHYPALSIRQIAAKRGVSYSFVHRLLSEAGVVMQPYGPRPRAGR